MDAAASPLCSVEGAPASERACDVGDGEVGAEEDRGRAPFDRLTEAREASGETGARIGTRMVRSVALPCSLEGPDSRSTARVGSRSERAPLYRFG